MRRLLLLVAALVLIGAAVPVHATSLNFQNPTDNLSIQKFKIGSASPATLQWTESTTGGNNYVSIYMDAVGNLGADSEYMILTSPLATTYAAATLVSSSGNAFFSGANVVLLDSAGNVLWRANTGSSAWTTTGRYEVKVSGGTAHVYMNGVEIATSGTLAQNPSYVGFGSYCWDIMGAGTTTWDAYTYGTTENLNNLGLPESDNETFYLLNDIATPANTGLWNGTSDTQANANNLPYQWSRGNTAIPPDALTNETINLVYYTTGAIYGTAYTGTAYSGTGNFDISGMSAWPDGYYAVTIAGTGAYSNLILKKSNGATVAFNADTYSTGDTATVVYWVMDGDYWSSANNYKMCIYSLTEGCVENTTITTQTGSVTHAWSEDDTPGVYYALLYMITPDGEEHLLGLDWATLSSYLNFITSYVNNAQTGAVIPGANVSLTQGTTICNVLAATDGNWSCDGFSTGAILYVNATNQTYRQYTYNFTPMVAKGVALNISLVPITPTFTDLAIGGVDRDTTYGRPIAGATIDVWNLTTGEHYTKTTSNTGWYLCDFGSACFHQTKTPYWVRASKVGYLNSTPDSQAVTA